MKANEFVLEEVLSKIPADDWGMAWEAIDNAVKKGIDFGSVASVTAFCKTYIWATKFNEMWVTRRITVKDENGEAKVVTRRDLRFASAEAEAERRAGWDRSREPGELMDMVNHDDVTPEEIAVNNDEEEHIGKMLARMGFCAETIKVMLSGGKVVETKAGFKKSKVTMDDMQNAAERRALKRLRVYYAN